VPQGRKRSKGRELRRLLWEGNLQDQARAFKGVSKLKKGMSNSKRETAYLWRRPKKHLLPACRGVSFGEKEKFCGERGRKRGKTRRGEGLVFSAK